MKFDFILRHRREFRLSSMCRVLNLSRSGFFAWSKRGVCQRKREDAQLLRQIQDIFERAKRRYGSPRIWAELFAQGWRVSRKRVARLMRLADLYAIRKQGYKRRKKADAQGSAAPNRLKQDFIATAMNQKWLADIAQIATGQGWLHLAVVLDTYSRRIIGWSMKRTAPSALAQDALKMALARRSITGTLIHHSDRGSQYTDRRYQQLLADHRIQASMSAAGNCYDNAMMESFFATLKTECANQVFHTINEAKAEILHYIEGWYNRHRRHSSLSFASPMQFEEAAN